MAPSKRPRRSTAKVQPANVPYDMGAFWDQHPHGEEIIIVFIAGDHMDKVQAIATARGEAFTSVVSKEVRESPANVMETLRRRARGDWRNADAFFRAGAYTAMLEGPKGTSAVWPIETLRIARLCSARVTTISWNRQADITIIIAEPEGIMSAGTSTDETRRRNPKARKPSRAGEISLHPLVIGDPTTRQVEAMMRDELGLDLKRDLLAARTVTMLARQVELNTRLIPAGCGPLNQRPFGWRVTANQAKRIVRVVVDENIKGRTRRGDPKPFVCTEFPSIARGKKTWRVRADGPPPVGLRAYDVDAMTGKAKRVV